MCETKANAEIAEVLEGIRRRCDILGVDLPWGAIVDNCCQFRGSIEAAIPLIKVFLDIFHCVAR